MRIPPHYTSPGAEGALLEAKEAQGRASLRLLPAPLLFCYVVHPFDADGPSWAARQRVQPGTATAVIATLSSLLPPFPSRFGFHNNPRRWEAVLTSR